MSRLSNIPSLHDAISAGYARRAPRAPAPSDAAPSDADANPMPGSAPLPAIRILPRPADRESTETRARSRRRQLWLSAAAIVAGTLAALAPFPAHNQPHPGTPNPGAPNPGAQRAYNFEAPLELSATREAAGWKVKWNPATTAGLEPEGAVLVIREGSNQVRVPFTPKEFSLGSIVYKPIDSQVVFSLRVNTTAGSMEQSVQAVDPVDLPAGPPEPGRPTIVLADSLSETTDVGLAAARPIKSAAPREMQRAAPAPVQVAGEAGAGMSVTAATAPAAPAQPSFDPSEASAADPRALAPGSANPAIQYSKPAPSFVAAQAVVRVIPDAPENLMLARNQSIHVQILVQIDDHGKIRRAVPAGAVSNPELTRRSAAAAKAWRFLPALRNGVPIPSEAVLTFEFSLP